MDRIYIVDAVNFLFRSYYAIGGMMNEKGQSTGALFGFIRSLLKLMKDFSPEYFVSVFDGPDNKKSRQAVYAEYKMHRKGAPEDLFPQFEWAYEYCKLAGIPSLCIEGVEADDTMATIALWAEKQGAKVYLCSSDKDLMQLVNNQIFVLHAHKDNLLVDEAKVKELFGVRPDQMLDYLAIVGDASDNIPGIEGFGPKTASALLEEFGTLDHILAHPERVKGEKKQHVLKTQQKEALMSRELATLDTQVEIPHEEEFYRLKTGHREKLIDFYTQMNFNTLQRELQQTSPTEKQDKNVAGKPRKADNHIYELIDEEKELEMLLEHLAKQKEVGLDTETTGVNPHLAELVGVGFCFEPGEAWYVPCNGVLGEAKVLEAFRSFFASAKCSFYGHNLKYDIHLLDRLGIQLHQISFDTILASYLLDPQNRRHNLDELALKKFQHVKIPIDSLISKGKDEISMREVPLEKVKEYCCEDIDYTTRLKQLFEEELAEKKLDRLFYDVELPLLSLLAKMEKRGIYLNVKKLEVLGEKLAHTLQLSKMKIFETVGLEFNLNSPKQLSEILFQKLGLKPPGKKRTEFSTGADVLETLAQEHPIAQYILDYRTLEKLRSTYIDTLPEQVNPETGRIHCTFNQSITATGRLSCQDPNLQNIPVRKEEGVAIRSCFEPEKKGWSFLGADYSQIELRILAHFSGDEELVRAFSSGRDIHTHTASLVFGVREKEVSPDMRAAAKAVNFGIVYGQGPFGLSQILHIPMREAADFIHKYFERYPRVLDYLESCKEETRKSGLSKTLTGRLRPIPEIQNKNPMIRAGAERLAMNTPLQGTAADLIKMAMLQIDKEILSRKVEGQMILQIHDELIFEIPDDEIPSFESFVKDKMENVLQLNVPIEVHIAIGKNWGEC